MIEFVTGFFLIVGAGFMLVAGLGVWRMPDLLTRMHATTKAGVLGAGLMLVGVGVYFWEVNVLVRVIAVIGFLMLTAPVAAHMIGRAGYFVGVPLWEHTLKDELKGQYDENTHTLASPPTAAQQPKDEG
ncbi:Na+/H+ antiporter subunit G [Thioalkalivibrio denitrificans]|uniref:Na+/H+ antiporter subunit G n=1 Tax=Thioalkalivibrio denitrificans TaxID=108003 RepID=A0A1V3NRF3_9GAMM|nr:monovalent cation/H(+) antiporter subunit G [Thioalkalivibrio denitrificans]OOG27630.1 Na+/H+ antiporter subunit G [Thioalkalivibrio denitrificans]